MEEMANLTINVSIRMHFVLIMSNNLYIQQSETRLPVMMTHSP